MALQENDRGIFHKEEDTCCPDAPSWPGHYSCKQCLSPWPLQPDTWTWPSLLCISRLSFQVLHDTGALSLSMAMGLASGLMTGQCVLTVPPPPRHRAWVQSASAPSLDVHKPILFPVSPPPQLQPNDSNTHQENHIISELERPSEVTCNRCALRGPGRGRVVTRQPLRATTGDCTQVCTEGQGNPYAKMLTWGHPYYYSVQQIFLQYLLWAWHYS